MTLLRIALIITIAFAMGTGCACAGYISPSAGYTAQDTVFAIPYAWSVYGFDVLPSGNFVAFIDSDIVEINRSGAVGSPLYSFANPVYGSFVKVRGETIYFGESSNGTVWSMGLDGRNITQWGVLDNSYDLDFDSLGRAFASANPGWAGQKVLHFDGTGSDVITDLNGYSGPLVFDASDNLIYATAYADGGDSLIRFDRDALIGALSGSPLTQTDGQVIAEISSPTDMTIDSLGNIYFTSGFTLYRLANGSSSPMPIATSENVLTILGSDPSGSIYVLLNAVTEGDSAVGVISSIIPTNPVPEPSSLVGITSLIALAGTGILRRRR